MNGSKPVSGTVAKVSSNTPQDLILFAGDFKSVSVNGNYFLNPDASEEQLRQLEGRLATFQNYLETKLGIPYKGKAVYIQTTPVSKNNSWLFASYPTIVNVGWGEGMKAFANKSTESDFLQFMAHELAHYYFGKVRSFNSAIGSVLSEGFAEYLALKITRSLIGEDEYREKMNNKARAMDNLRPAPLQAIRSEADYGSRQWYVYDYALLLFLGIEKEIGEDRMWAWIKSLLLTPAIKTDYAFFEQTLEKAVADKTTFKSLREKYLHSDKSLQNLVSTLQITTGTVAAANTQTPVAKTYYYFIFSRPMTDIGSSQNKMIAHTAVAQLTCLPSEFIDRVSDAARKVKESCINAAGSTNDVNRYNTLEEAQAALKTWLARYNKNGTMQVKTINHETTANPL